VAERSDLLEKLGDLSQIADVRRIGAEAEGIRSGLCPFGLGELSLGELGLGELGAGRVQALPRPAGDHHRGSVGQAAPGHRQPDARAAADDDDRAACVD
jgi:hypothetical protein